MPKFEVLLERKVVEFVVVFVEAESEEVLRGRLGEVYEAYLEGDWVPREDEEGEHRIRGRGDDLEQPDMKLVEDGVLLPEDDEFDAEDDS